jgi:hypothetical protein
MSTQGRSRPEADSLRQATDSPQGLSVSGLSPKGECSRLAGQAVGRRVHP